MKNQHIIHLLSYKKFQPRPFDHIYLENHFFFYLPFIYILVQCEKV